MTIKTVVAITLALTTGAALAGHPGRHNRDESAHHAEHSAHDSHSDHETAMHGSLGFYPMARDGSGTSWQPEAVPFPGIHWMSGHWTQMVHGFADVVYDHQGGPRGDSKLFFASMVMAMGQRPLGAGLWSLRGMFSLDPLMGRTGYPLLFQTGESADGVTPLVDRQHPHDFFVELATSYSVPLGGGSIFGYFGLPGEPALGPTTFMHRSSGMQLPEAPLTHHWLDSTHITFGVATLGAIHGAWKVEASAFNGREPDESRWNIETEPLDSWSGRVTVNPSSRWSAQVSRGYLVSPEQLEPEVNVHRTTASISYADGSDSDHWSSTAAVGINRAHGEDHPAYLLEATRQLNRKASLFGRVEYLENEHLADDVSETTSPQKIGKLSLGGTYLIANGGPLAFRAGALMSAYSVPAALEHEYGSGPVSFMLFLRTSIEE